MKCLGGIVSNGPDVSAVMDELRRENQQIQTLLQNNQNAAIIPITAQMIMRLTALQGSSDINIRNKVQPLLQRLTALAAQARANNTAAALDINNEIRIILEPAGRGKFFKHRQSQMIYTKNYEKTIIN